MDNIIGIGSSIHLIIQSAGLCPAFLEIPPSVVVEAIATPFVVNARVCTDGLVYWSSVLTQEGYAGQYPYSK